MDGLNSTAEDLIRSIKETLPVASKAFTDSYTTYMRTPTGPYTSQKQMPPAPPYQPNWWLIGGGIAVGILALGLWLKKK